MFEKLPSVLATKPVLAWQAQFCDFALVVEFSDTGDAWTITIGKSGLVVKPGAASGAAVRLTAAKSAWQKFVSPVPPIGFQTLAGMFSTHNLDVSGNYMTFSRYLFLIEGVFGSLRSSPDETVKPYGRVSVDPVVGRYMRLDIDGRPHRVYFEEAGEGIPLLCLHTAGSDGRQYRALMNDAEITKRFRVIAFDLPWHGKSSPPPGFEDELYTLTTDRYVTTVMTIKRALYLDRPVVMGCSIGGRAVLHLALRHGDEFRAAIGLQSALYAEARPAEGADGMSQLYRPDTNGPEVGAASVASLIAPQSPSSDRWETLWHYMQGGPGVFMGDLYYYFVDGDLRNGGVRDLDPTRCPLYLLSGEYDLSATPEMGAALAREVGAIHFEVMEGLGHFPMSENPAQFRKYILPVLDKIHTASHSAAAQ